MKEIELTQGQITIVDDEDYEYLSQWKWYAKLSISTGKFYAVRSDRTSGKHKTIWMHRVIMKTPKDMETDHKDLNTLLNLRSNLRNATASQNRANKNAQKNNKNKYKGVSPSSKNRYMVNINRDGKRIYVGNYEKLKDAALAYDKKAIELFGEFARLNFHESEL